jgi:hypothetical protein
MTGSRAWVWSITAVIATPPRLESQSEHHLKQTRVVLLRSNLAEGVVGGRRLSAIGGCSDAPIVGERRLEPVLAFATGVP